MKIKVFIVDDHDLFKEGIKLLLRNEKELEVVGDAANGAEFLQKVEEIKPDVVLMDINMPVMNGIDATRAAVSKYPNLKVLALTMFEEGAYISEMMKARAHGYLLKNTGREELLGAIKKVIAGEKYLSASVTVKLIDSVMNPVSKPSPVSPSMNDSTERKKVDITKRELTIIKLIAQEMTNQEIADKLDNSPMTIITHRKNLLRKLGVKNTAGLIKYAVQNGLLDD